MKGAMLYVDAGKGHYIPAKALADSFIRGGHEATVENLFTVYGSSFWNKLAKYTWRCLLHFPRLEPSLTKGSDSRLNAFLMKRLVSTPKYQKAFMAWYEKEKPDFIVSTNFIGGEIIPETVKRLNLDIPVFQYLADVFDTPKTGVNNSLDRMYTASELGKKNAILKGQREDTISICSFPIQYKFESHEPLGKKEARAKLGLDDEFTILCSLGGEGIASVKLLYRLAEENLKCQFVVIGGKSRSTEKKFREFKKRFPDFNLRVCGFVDNVPDYLAACDIQIGKAGANGVMEAIYMRRPFIVTEVLYPFIACKDFIAKNPVGWCENSIEKQVEIIMRFSSDEAFRKQIEENFSVLPLRFGSDAFRDEIIEDIRKLQ
ncbi:MAG: UDP-N-acetylglucosamine--LPS N-acetylglucosamine transferase [Spirochaetes bacterium]|uniref:UDP-N-acetylglucosamine--LPS N-acetylglucosamine transferase n=1 Tax=Candidatus Ornithospirochaeta stercoripullorum TaxID=2840899 RepID=A0A9D9E062_9SPIO|nr:UDP-N-acetylglucosamine--LPS N-acetylglucosamine transferase [Candidatus Ornithospirochaeta stercoripullorum]